MEVKRRVKTFPRHNTQLDSDRAVYRSILSTTWLGFSVPASGSVIALLRLCYFDRVTQRVVCHRHFATGSVL